MNGEEFLWSVGIVLALIVMWVIAEMYAIWRNGEEG